MPGFIIVLVLLACVFLFFGCSQKANQNISLNQQAKILSRKNIETRLKEISETEAPTDLNVGALCYSVVINQVKPEFICPVCGNKTIYPEKSNNAFFISNQLLEIQREVNKLKGFNINLDKTQFCKKCSPSVKNPKLFLIINYSDAPPSKVPVSNSEDIILLNDFLTGKITYIDNHDNETPLKEHLPKIKELLGVK